MKYNVEIRSTSVKFWSRIGSFSTIDEAMKTIDTRIEWVRKQGSRVDEVENEHNTEYRSFVVSRLVGRIFPSFAILTYRIYLS